MHTIFFPNEIYHYGSHTQLFTHHFVNLIPRKKLVAPFVCGLNSFQNENLLESQHFFFLYPEFSSVIGCLCYGFIQPILAPQLRKVSWFFISNLDIGDKLRYLVISKSKYSSANLFWRINYVYNFVHKSLSVSLQLGQNSIQIGLVFFLFSGFNSLSALALGFIADKTVSETFYSCITTPPPRPFPAKLRRLCVNITRTLKLSCDREC